jgi:archaetidylinositol phosphate synthase
MCFINYYTQYISLRIYKVPDMLERLRPRVKFLIDPVAKKINVNPNYLTIIGLLISLLSAYMFANKNLLIGGILILLSGIFDIIDGAVARNKNSYGKFGGILDSTCDRFSDAFILIGIIYGGYTNWIYGILAIHASLTVSYVRARAEADGINCKGGLMERAERLIILSFGAFLGLINSEIMSIAVIMIVILGYFTVLQRLYCSWRYQK